MFTIIHCKVFTETFYIKQYGFHMADFQSIKQDI